MRVQIATFEAAWQTYLLTHTHTHKIIWQIMGRHIITTKLISQKGEVISGSALGKLAPFLYALSADPTKILKVLFGEVLGLTCQQITTI